jgi:hypothetical protein
LYTLSLQIKESDAQTVRRVARPGFSRELFTPGDTLSSTKNTQAIGNALKRGLLKRFALFRAFVVKDPVL